LFIQAALRGSLEQHGDAMAISEADAAILEESFALLERRNEFPPLEETLAQPSETRNQRARREIAERSARSAVERKNREAEIARKTAASSTMDPDTQAKWDAWLQMHLRRALDDFRENYREVVAEVIAEVTAAEDAKLVKLRADFELKLDALAADFAKHRAVETGGVVDLLPPVPHRKRNASA
jgi:hypothetical protein